MEKQIDSWVASAQRGKHINKQTNTWRNEYAYRSRYVDRWTNNQMDRKIDRWI